MSNIETLRRPRTLDRTKWHQPLMSIIITHHDYSDHVEDALLSIIDQTHRNLECVIIDDCSDDDHRRELHQIVRFINDPRIRVIDLPENLGQIGAFFAGLDETSGKFVCPLDPDDRYTPEFIEESLEAHLNEAVFVPLVCSDQYTLEDNEVVASVMTRHGMNQSSNPYKFIAAGQPGHWSTTSSMCFRRAALEYLRPHRPVVTRHGVEMRGIDAYLAPAAHKMGGTIFICKPLIYRSAHDDNSWLRKGRVSLFHSPQRDDAIARSADLKLFADEVMRVNGAPLVSSKRTSRRLLAKWKRSIMKRVRRLVG